MGRRGEPRLEPRLRDGRPRVQRRGERRHDPLRVRGEDVRELLAEHGRDRDGACHPLADRIEDRQHRSPELRAFGGIVDVAAQARQDLELLQPFGVDGVNGVHREGVVGILLHLAQHPG